MTAEIGCAVRTRSMSSSLMATREDYSRGALGYFCGLV
jgi:hypothetical protein